jgi:hypothetical protein
VMLKDAKIIAEHRRSMLRMAHLGQRQSRDS